MSYPQPQPIGQVPIPAAFGGPQAAAPFYNRPAVYGQTYGQNPYQPVGPYAAQPVYGQPGYVQAQANRVVQGVPVPAYGGYRKRKSAKSKAKAKRKRGPKRKTHRRRRQ